MEVAQRAQTSRTEQLIRSPLERRTSLVVRLLAVADTIVVALFMAGAASDTVVSGFRDRLVFILLVPLFQALFHTFGLYESHRLHGIRGVLRTLFAAEFVGCVIGLTTVILVGREELIPNILAFSAANTLLLAMGRLALYSALSVARRKGVDARHVCVISTWEKAQEIANHMRKRTAWGMKVTVVGVTGPDGGHEFRSFPGGEDLGRELSGVLLGQVIDEVLIAVEPERLAAERPTIAQCEQFGVMGRVLIECKTEPEAPLPLHSELPVSNALRDERHVWLKRLLDVTGGVAGIVGFGIPMLLVAMLVKISSPGPVLFRQRRVGLNGREFIIYKFRTMVEGAEAMLIPANRSITKGPVFKDSNDYRVTPVGHYLRRFSLDELPQFFNVLKGDMSLVGPRPLPPGEAGRILGPYRRRFRVLPGLTGIWQVSGRSDIEFERWMNYDLEYVDNWSIGLDLKIILRTLPVVLTGKGAY